MSLSVVTPTLRRPEEVVGLLENLAAQTVRPDEVILVDGAPPDEIETEKNVLRVKGEMPFIVRYIRHGGGTAIQRNVGIEAAQGQFIALIDDDIRLARDFFEVMVSHFEHDQKSRIGGITGFIDNQYFDPSQSTRWKWKKYLRLHTTYEPGRFDIGSGYTINRYMQPPFDGVKEVDFMGAGCAVWRRQVFDEGLRFDHFFTGFGVLEDAHLALRAKKSWVLLECGSAHCKHLHSEKGRENSRLVARKTALNHRFVFIDLVPERDIAQELRFWAVQFFDLLQFVLYAVRHRKVQDWKRVLGKVEGIWQASRI